MSCGFGALEIFPKMKISEIKVCFERRSYPLIELLFRANDHEKRQNQFLSLKASYRNTFGLQHFAMKRAIIFVTLLPKYCNCDTVNILSEK